MQQPPAEDPGAQAQQGQDAPIRVDDDDDDDDADSSFGDGSDAASETT
jgi:hypothetical protein